MAKKDTSIDNYISKFKFGARFQAIRNALSIMRQDLDKEKKDAEKRWAYRETQIDQIASDIARMQGEVDAISDI